MEISERFDKLLGKGSFEKLVPTSLVEEIKTLFSPCCGVGKKVIRIKDSLGYNTSIKEYPVTLDSGTYTSQTDLEDKFASNYTSGNGHVVALMNPRKILVICNRSLKSALVDFPDFAIKS